MAGITDSTRTARQRLLPHGGARNRADRTSRWLTEKQCCDLIACCEQAAALGAQFNRFVTISWENSGINARDNAKATGALIKRASQWMAARGHKLRWAWVQEWSHKAFGAHVHILLHVPLDLEPLFRAMPMRWVKSVLGRGRYVTGTVTTRKLYYAGSYGVFSDAYHAELMGKAHYMLKAAPAALEAKLGMEGYCRTGPDRQGWGYDCMVYGKRLGIWQGWKADHLPRVGGNRDGHFH